MPRTLSLKVIERRIRELEQKAEEIKKASKPGLSQLKALLVKYRLGWDDVRSVFGPSSLRGKASRGNPLKGQKVKPKYRNPGNRSETWSGRGLKPRWMVEALKGGKKVDDFLISKPTKVRAKAAA